jgi:hypothetical protein
LREAAEREAAGQSGSIGVTPRLIETAYQLGTQTPANAWPVSGSTGLVRHPEVSPNGVTPPTGLPVTGPPAATGPIPTTSPPGGSAAPATRRPSHAAAPPAWPTDGLPVTPAAPSASATPAVPPASSIPWQPTPPPMASLPATAAPSATVAPAVTPATEPAAPPPDLSDLDLTQRLPTVRYRGHYNVAEAEPWSEQLGGTSRPQAADAIGQQVPTWRATTAPTLPTPSLVEQPKPAAEPDEPVPKTRSHLPRLWHHKAPAALGLSHRPSRGVMVAIIAAVVVLVVGLPIGILALTGRFSSTPAPEPSPSPSIVAGVTPSPGEEGATDWALDRKLTSGELVFTITKIETGLTQLGDQTNRGVSVNGQWVVVSILVEYIGETEGTFLPNLQGLRTDPAGYYQNDLEGALWYQSSTLGSEPLKPGQPRSGVLAFDIPQSAKPIALELLGELGLEPIVVPLG